MIRRALIIYCDNTQSGVLEGTIADNENYRWYLQTDLGGGWHDSEIKSLRNPTALKIKEAIANFLNGADYTFIIFSGHGCTGTETGAQYLEVSEGDILLFDLKTSARRQTIIMDACRGFHSFNNEILKGIDESSFLGSGASTRELFEQAVMSAEAGWSILFSADVDESAIDTAQGGGYLFSLIKAAEIWSEVDRRDLVLRLNMAHGFAKQYLSNHFYTTQNPIMIAERRRLYFPFGVKFVSIRG
ncbi:caspase family protein [Mucilaginibacter sp. L196]|uniref:caspase family protein n=1 Tax=Mucilaginibacter sp. L196 TaxID=1641870 RepID=UPI00131BD42D|nr:caspase family protein [Mucilaginibacter sp. L196]